MDEIARKPVPRFALQLLDPSVHERARVRDDELLGTKILERLETDAPWVEFRSERDIRLYNHCRRVRPDSEDRPWACRSRRNRSWWVNIIAGREYRRDSRCILF